MKKIISVGFDIPSDIDSDDIYESYMSPQSLLDADIVIFEPFPGHIFNPSSYRGKPYFNEDQSFRLQEATVRWHSEISATLQDGKTVFVFMRRYERVYVCTGKKYSGTGKNARVNSTVSLYDNYKFLPTDIPNLIPREGTELKFRGNSIFTTFWGEFKKYIRYESYMNNEISESLFVTKTGNKPVGGLFNVGKGNLVLLPPIKYPENFAIEEDEEECWTEDAITFGNRLIQVLVDIDNALRSSVETSPPPDWIEQEEYKLKQETMLKKKIGSVSKKIEVLTEEKNTLLSTQQREIKLKHLVYEKGRPLENAVIEALKILGYKAESYDDGNLEIDQIIIAPEGGRYIGETEGKDRGAINIDKFRQLESNIQEDLQQENVTEPAIGILFGNGFRVTPPQQREEQFTGKCIKNAARLNAILVKTPDLFEVARYIKENRDKKFAKKCRKAISESKGRIVKFPEISPESKKKS